MILNLLFCVLIITFHHLYSEINIFRRDYLTKYILSSLEHKRIEERPPLPVYNESADYLISTPGCKIPNYMKSMTFNEAPDYNSECGIRFVFVRAVRRKLIEFTISEKQLEVYKKNITNVQCCYQFGRQSTDKGIKDRKLVFSRCIVFKNGTLAKLKSFIVTVTCYTITKNTQEKTNFYSDAYLIYMRNKIITERTKETRPDNGHWNVLMVGIDTMSRGRAYKFLPETIKFLKDNKWINYRGYNKVGLNSNPNFMALMTGNKMQHKENCSCCDDIYDNCNKNLMWSHYKQAGYTTAYGEECIYLNIFGEQYGFDEQPTDYYLRPFFVSRERTEGNLQCTGQQSSVKQLLNYAADFTNAYKNGKFFTYFWFNGVGHDYGHHSSFHDEDFLDFLKKVTVNEAMQNTFVFFFSDHGLVFGNYTEVVAGFYESRLPMMFIHVPFRFREMHKDKYYNIMLNENRLTSPYNFHATLWDILKLSNSSVEVIPPEGCPQCTSLLNEQSPLRTCEDAGVDEKWCTCKTLVAIPLDNTEANYCVELAVTYLQNVTNNIKTKPCTICSPLTLNKVLHMDLARRRGSDKTVYIVTFNLTPGDMAYEASFEKDENEYKLLPPTRTITPYGPNTECVYNDLDRGYCICSTVENCINA